MVDYDVKGRRGNWQIMIRRGIYSYSGQKWASLLARCKPNSQIVQTRSRYEGCKNIFESYDAFVEWLRLQKGYGTIGWCLDKDILIKGNKIYSPDTCLLVPHELNCLILSRNKLRGAYPVGVYYQKDRCKFSAQVNFGQGCKKHLGSYETPEEAFGVYKLAKEGFIKQQAEKWRDKIEERAYEALMEYQVEITD